MKARLQLLVLLFAKGISVVAASSEHVHRAQVRRHVHPEVDVSRVAAISPEGSILSAGLSSLPELGNNSTLSVITGGQVASHETVQSASKAERRNVRRKKGKSRLARILKVHLRPQRIWSVVFLAKHYLKPARRTATALPVLKSADADTPGEEKKLKNGGDWTAAFLVSLVALGFISSHIGGKYKVELQPDDDLLAARGRPCWISCCGASVVLLSLLTFLFTLFVLAPGSGNVPDDPDIASGRQVEHPGERAFEAGQGVALSVAFMGLLVFSRRHLHSVQISSSLLAQFAIRGATLSVLIASILETSWIYGMRRVTGLPPHAVLPAPGKLDTSPALGGAAATMFMVGVSEEFAKACAVLCGTWLSAGALRLAAPHWFFRLWRVLVESPRALMLAGLSVGCGFMTLENVGYLLSASLMNDKDDSATAERFIRCLIVGVRVGLNLHPWLCGITCARMARVAFAEERETLNLSFKELAWALWPAAVAHGAFDFGVLALPGLLAIFLPVVFWFGARRAFDQEWATFDSSARTLENDPSEEATSQHVMGE